MSTTPLNAFKLVQYPLNRGSKMLFVSKANQIPVLVQLWHSGIVSGDAVLQFHVCLNNKSKPCHMPDLDLDISKNMETSLTSICGLGDALIYGYLNVKNVASVGVINSFELLNDDKYATGLPNIQ